ncbi:MAG: FxsA family protein [Pseudohongiellaceae bacterium]
MRAFPLLLLLLPVFELLLLIEVGSEIGGLATLGLLVLAGIIGLGILRGRGIATLIGARRRMASGDLPGQDVLDSMLLAGGGLLLLIPGFLTDACSLPLLLPWTRRALARRLLRSSGFRAFGGGPGGFTGFRASSRSQTWTREGGEIVEGEVLHETRPDSQLKGPPPG